MDNVLIPIIIAVIPALAAVLSPFITSIFKARTSLKLKRLECIYDTKLKVFQDFAKHFGNINDKCTSEDFTLFFSSAYQAMLICSDTTRPHILKLVTYMKDNIFDFHKENFNIENIYRVELDRQFEKCSQSIYIDLQSESLKIKHTKNNENDI